MECDCCPDGTNNLHEWDDGVVTCEACDAREFIALLKAITGEEYCHNTPAAAAVLRGQA